MDRKLFSKIRNGSHPKKATAISLCIALELSLKETNDLLIKAGYKLNNSEKFDVIITDGLENASKEYSSKEVKKMIKEQQDKHNREFLFLGANIDAVETVKSYGIAEDYSFDFW